MTYPFGLDDVASSLYYITQHDNSLVDYHTSFKDPHRFNPIYLLLHNQILQFKKDDIDKFTFNKNFYRNFYSLSLSTKKSLLFIPFLKIGAFEEHLNSNTKWFKENLITHSDKELDQKLDFCFKLEYGIKYKDSVSISKKFDEKDFIMNTIYDSLVYNSAINNNFLFNIDNLMLTFDKFDRELNLSQNFLSKIYDIRHPSNLQLFQFILQYNPNINKELSINDIFSKFNHYETSIHFNETQIETLSHFLNYKFKFDESKIFNNENTFIHLVKTGNDYLIKTALPFLHNIVPPNGNWDAQNAFINSLQTNGTKKDLAQFITNIYEKNLLSYELNQKSTKSSLPKIKI